MDAAEINYDLKVVDLSSMNLENSKVKQAQDDLKFSLQYKAVPTIVHEKYKILSDMTKFVLYLSARFKKEMTKSGNWPQNNH